MYEGIIKTLIRLFAIITNFQDKSLADSSITLVESYLNENFSRDLVLKYSQMYNNYINYYHQLHREVLYDSESGERAFNEAYLKSICKTIVSEFDMNARFLIVLQLLNFIKKETGEDKDDLSTVNFVASGLKIGNKEYDNLKRFSLSSIKSVKEKSSLFVVNGHEKFADPAIKHLYREGMKVQVELILIHSINSFFFKYHGPLNLYLNGHRLAQHRIYTFPQGGILKTSRITPIYYSSIMTRFIQNKGESLIVYNALDIEYRFNRKHFGLHPFSFQERSGDFVGILGGSGVGKTTLLNVLNGKLKPNNGSITINGYDLHDQKNEEKLKGIIGYVPQDDLLLEELTVYKNLEFNARFCFGSMSDEEINTKIEETLIDFDLVEARNLVVGSPLKKILSGGQRKRLNIALELMREPSILFADEPTSGLSSSDSEKVMHLLKRQCLKGKLVFANIHQPSSDLYKMFDRVIIMDNGGRVIFFGNPMDAITYFKTEANYINPNSSECLNCGNVKTEQPLRIIQTRMVDPFGKTIRKRKFSPEEWYLSYKEKVEPKVLEFIEKNPVKKEIFPDIFFKIPAWFQQIKLFIQRDVATKKANRQYLAIAFLEAPLLALILGLISKYSNSDTYLFRYNDNIPAYLFMSVIVALFIGLSISAEEIFKDRKILQREQFLNLSRGAYLSSKILILFFISAIQVLSFVLVGHFILEIHGLALSTWAILFSTACFANLLGLNISAGFNSAVTIYVLVPFLLVPQLLLSGVIVDFNKMNPVLSSYNQTPLIGDIMTSRWAYEAQAVNMVKNNTYRQMIFEKEEKKNDLSFKTHYLVPEVSKYLSQYNASYPSLTRPSETENILLNSFSDMFSELGSTPDSVLNAYSKIGTDEFTTTATNILKSYLTWANTTYKEAYDNSTVILDKEYAILKKRLGGTEMLVNLRNRYANKKMDNLVRDKYTTRKLYVVNNRIYQADEPIFRQPAQANGRAHFYASHKNIAGYKIDTILFNISIIWLLIAFLMVTLYFDILRKVIHYVESWRLLQQTQKQNKIFTNPMAFMHIDSHKHKQG